VRWQTTNSFVSTVMKPWLEGDTAEPGEGVPVAPHLSSWHSHRARLVCRQPELQDVEDCQPRRAFTFFNLKLNLDSVDRIGASRQA
jgi:hypothetical protein